MPIISSYGAPPQVTVVEYLEPLMSKDLLVKFPDNSAFDFDYAQSSIWSPLLPPPPPTDSFVGGRLDISRKLSYGGNDDVGLLENTKKIAARIKRKFTDTLLNNVSKCSRMKRRKRKSFGFSPVCPSRRLSSSSPSPKVWAKVMKAAAKHFKKRKSRKGDDSNLNFDKILNLDLPQISNFS